MENNCVPVAKTVKCPKCGRDIRTSVTRVLTPDSQAIIELLHGKLNCVLCPGCSTLFRLSGQLIYRDADNAFLLVQDELPEDGNTEELEKEVDCMATDAAIANELERPTVRLVFNREDFVEKMFLQRNGFDDKMIEYAKYQLFQGGTDELLSRKKYRLLYNFSNKNPDVLEFVVYEREGMKPVKALQVPREEYDKLCAEFEVNADAQKQLEMLFPNCYVNVDRLFEYAD